VRGVSAEVSGFGDGRFAAFVVGVGGCAVGYVAVASCGKGGSAAVVVGVTGCAGGCVRVSALGTVW